MCIRDRCLAGYNDFRNFIENKKPGSCRQNEFGKVIETIQRGSMTSVFKDVYLRTFRIRHRSFNKFLSKLYSKRLIFKRKNNIYSDNNKDLPLDPNEIGKCEKHASYFIQQLLYQKSLLNGLGIKFVASLQPALGYGDREITTEGEKYLIKKITNSRVSSRWNSLTKRSWDQTQWYSDMSYVKKKLGWSPKINYKIGLYKTLTWYKYFYNKYNEKIFSLWEHNIRKEKKGEYVY